MSEILTPEDKILVSDSPTVPKDDKANQVMEIIAKMKDSILSGWDKSYEMIKSNDLIAVIEPGTDETVSLIVGPRKMMLDSLSADGVDLLNESVLVLQQPAIPPQFMPGASAIWVVVRSEGFVHITKMVNQPMSAGGSS